MDIFMDIHEKSVHMDTVRQCHGNLLYSLSKVTKNRLVRNFECNVAACSHDTRAPNPGVDCTFDIAASPLRVWDCSHFGKSVSFHDLKSDAGFRV